MPVTRQRKEADREALAGLIAKAQSVVVAHYAGLTVEQVSQLRNQCRSAGVTYKVAKNTVAKIALKGTPFEQLAPLLKGPIAMALSPEDPAAGAKVLLEYAKENEKLVIIGAALPDQKALDAKGVKTLSTLPGRNELRAQLLGVLTAPARNFVSVLAAGPRSLLNVLQARQTQLEAKS